jgi:hypothetical protein
MSPIEKKEGGEQAKMTPRRRIETQIHRRKKAPAVPPLQSEWDQSEGRPPERLRMPSEKMSKRTQIP